jgi:hypothetical protein
MASEQSRTESTVQPDLLKSDKIEAAAPSLLLITRTSVTQRVRGHPDSSRTRRLSATSMGAA